MLDIKFIPTQNPKPKPDWSKLGFGKYFTDHMFVMDYTEGKGWHDPRIVPFGDITLSPAAMVLHYGQEMFEGLKAYLSPDGRILLFRPQKNIERMNETNRRLCIPEVDPDDVLEAIKAIVRTDRDWIPSLPGTSLYIRPFIFATDPYLGVRISQTYKFMIILSPVGAYYPEGINPVKIWIEDDYVRAVKGGIGEAQTGGNYVASLNAQIKAYSEGYTQVLWLDAKERRYVEEVGTMNIFFKIDNVLITAPLDNGTILAGITRDSVINLARDMGYTVEERQLSIEDVFDAHKDGRLEEVFGTGTAAVISPVGRMNWKDNIIEINGGRMGELSQKLYERITAIQYGKEPDKYGWIEKIED